MKMNDETKFYGLVAVIVLVFFGFLAFAIYTEKATRLECVNLLKDKPAIEILGVCK